jgi:AcrR family transcriptional regulator
MIDDERILDAALDVIAERGYVAATTRRIAEAAGVNEVTLFRRFGNKQQLLMAAAAREARQASVAEIEYTGNLEADLLRIVEFYHELMDKRARTVVMLLSELPRQPELREAMNTPIGIVETVTDLLQRYQEEGALQPETPITTFYALVGPIYLEAAAGLALEPKDRNGAGSAWASARIDPADHVRRFLAGRRRE